MRVSTPMARPTERRYRIAFGRDPGNGRVETFREIRTVFGDDAVDYGLPAVRWLAHSTTVESSRVRFRP